jgi:hypothetical protein
MLGLPKKDGFTVSETSKKTNELRDDSVAHVEGLTGSGCRTEAPSEAEKVRNRPQLSPCGSMRGQSGDLI